MAVQGSTNRRSEGRWWRRLTPRRASAAAPTTADACALAQNDRVKQLTNYSTYPSISQTRTLPATASTLSLNRGTGTVSGLLTVGEEPLTFAPQAVHAAKGVLRINRDGIFTYTPRTEARQAATRPDATFFGHHRDTLLALAYDSRGAQVRVRATIAILGF